MLSGSLVNMDSDGNDSDGFSLPRFSSINPAAGVGFQNFDSMNRRGTFNYLHDNIDEETMRDPILQRMPILKNINRRNLIPIIDFEEFNKSSQNNNIYSSGLSNNSVRPLNFKVNYLTVYLGSALRTLAPEYSSVLFTLPSVQSDNIVFHPYPSDKLIEYQDLEKILSYGIQGPSNVSL